MKRHQESLFDMPDGTPEPGDWVKVWGQVSEEPTHPEDFAVRIQSHNQDYVAHVRRDWVEPVEAAPSWALKCPHLHGSPSGLRMVRCGLHSGHGGQHIGPNQERWDTRDTIGYFEDK